MIYKILQTTEEGKIYARIDDDGLCRVTCTEDNPDFQEYLKSGAELQDAEGNTMSAEQATQFVKELP